MKTTKCLFLCLALLSGATVLRAQNAPEWQWAVCAGNTGTDIGQSIAIDSQGNQYITGHFWGTTTFGSQTLTASGHLIDDIFVAKLDPSGNWLWAVNAGGTGTGRGYGIAVDDMDNVYVTGRFLGTATFGSQTITGGGILVAKLDPSGNWLWVATGAINYGEDIAVDSSGNVWVTGSFGGTAIIGSHTLTASGGQDIFVAKLNPSGNWIWAARAGGSNEDNGHDIAVDGAGNAYVTGYFGGTATFGSQTLTSSGSWDAFVAKLDPDGNWLCAVQAGGSGCEEGYGITVDGAGNAWVTGSYQNTATFGNHSLAYGGNGDIFIAKLDPSGNWLWATRAGGGDFDYGHDIVLDGAGNAWVTGEFRYTSTFGSHTLTAFGGGYSDIFVAKLNTFGNWLWAVQAGDVYKDIGYGIAVDGEGNALVTGRCMGAACFGSHCLTASGLGDIFVAKLENLTPVEDEITPQALARLHNAYPNPLNRGASALIKAEIPERTTGNMTIFNLRGQIVARHKLSPGSQQITFSGEGLPAGVYLYSLQCGDYRETRKLVLLK
ncbi:MAG TPA: SBBP repeat-containing protein [Candidatus Cloacimonadota bacterium]|nr:SBBP repeat-containing protein [Candidatus Cloacimonadota bacterium]